MFPPFRLRGLTAINPRLSFVQTNDTISASSDSSQLTSMDINPYQLATAPARRHNVDPLPLRVKLVLGALCTAYVLSLPMIALAASWVIVPEGGFLVVVILLIVLAAGFKPIEYLKRNPIWIHRLCAWISRDAHSYNRLGYALLQKQKTSAGIDQLNRAIQADPTLAVAHSNRCIAWCQQQEWDRAVKDAETAIDLDPHLPQAYSNRAVPYIETQQYAFAITDCDRAIELDADLAEAYMNRASAQTWLGRNEAALADLNTAVELGMRSLDVLMIRWSAMLGLQAATNSDDLDHANTLKLYLAGQSYRESP